ncbi:MAG: hypothetical protein ACYS6W_11715 [Planctomycetota bacterium]|jgi:hypothetical protein
MANDVSGCLEMTAAYASFNRFDSGLYGVGFDCTGNASERIWGKDPTACVTASTCYLHYLALTCGSSTVNLVDGSGGAQITCPLAFIDVTSGGPQSIVYDFRDDPLALLTAENTQSLCISATNGYVQGFMKLSWGP